MIVMTLKEALRLVASREDSLAHMKGTARYERHVVASVIVAASLMDDLSSIGALDHVQAAAEQLIRTRCTSAQAAEVRN